MNERKALICGAVLGLLVVVTLRLLGFDGVGAYAVFILIPMIFLPYISISIRQKIPGAVDKHGMPDRELSQEQVTKYPVHARWLRLISLVAFFLFGILFVFLIALIFDIQG